jgi:hypothetical protein
MASVSNNSFTGTLFVLLLLCSVCIAPVMAGTGTRVIEDGVHLIKLDDSPPVLNPDVYHLYLAEDVIVDGNQFYWVRIGSVKAEGLSSAWWTVWIISTILFMFLIFVAFYWDRLIKRFFPQLHANVTNPTDQKSNWVRFKANMLYSLPITIITITLGILIVSGMLPHAITHTVCGDYMDLKASDGTILLQVDKLHPETNTLYMKSGINLSALTHLSGSGNIIPTHGVNPT